MDVYYVPDQNEIVFYKEDFSGFFLTTDGQSKINLQWVLDNSFDDLGWILLGKL